jgi:indole-3-glycerol phosphate synthase / phosphoribosylanthranilate isomerase
MDVLSEIIAKKRERLAEAKEIEPLKSKQWKAAARRAIVPPHLLQGALQNEGTNIIAEFKRRSPSKGVIRPDADRITIAQAYQSGGASAISVLTEEDYFDGSLIDLRAVKSAVNLPVLRKDFVFDPYQVYESAAAAADAILLIVAALNDRELESLRRLAEDELGMDALVEVHNADEMRRAVACGATLIGVNNRNLRTFEVSLETSVELAGLAPSGTLLVSESGLNEAAELRRLKEVGFSGFLIGESLMRAADPAAALRRLRGDVLVKICGITNLEDALAAVDAGADALGFNFYQRSPRYIAPHQAREIIEQLPASIMKVGVFVNEEPDTVLRIADEVGLTAIQLHGDESPEYCQNLAGRYMIKALGATANLDLNGYNVDAIMFDTKDELLHGGTGRMFDWSLAQRSIKPELFLAGGLSPENVAEAIRTVRPYAVDACSSLEESPGKKNHQRLRAFVNNVRSVKP